MAFADRDFYYGDPAFPPEEPVAGLLSKEYAKQRFAGDARRAQRPRRAARRPLSLPGRARTRSRRSSTRGARCPATKTGLPEHDRPVASAPGDEAAQVGTTSVIAADAEGWVVSMTPSGAWNPAVIAGRTGIGLSQRMQSFVLDERENPYNVLAPGKQPRVTLTPTLSLEGRPAPPRLRRPGRRHPGPEPAAVLPERRRVRHERAAGGRGPERQQPPAAQLLRRPRVASRAPDPRRLDARGRARRSSRPWATRWSSSRSRPAPSTRSSSTAPHGTMWGGSSHHGEDYGIAW